jgi:hypothetical protein|tara:strand:+ start:15841 stop:21330 length:5490 start_codon:yes stop_codon:yes gene_type:complete
MICGDIMDIFAPDPALLSEGEELGFHVGDKIKNKNNKRVGTILGFGREGPPFNRLRIIVKLEDGSPYMMVASKKNIEIIGRSEKVVPKAAKPEVKKPQGGKELSAKDVALKSLHAYLMKMATSIGIDGEAEVKKSFIDRYSQKFGKRKVNTIMAELHKLSRRKVPLTSKIKSVILGEKDEGKLSRMLRSEYLSKKVKDFIDKEMEKRALAEDKPLPTASLKPYQEKEVAGFVKKGDYRIVNIEFKTARPDEKYIIFETDAKVAGILAKDYATRLFGDDYKSLSTSKTAPSFVVSAAIGEGKIIPYTNPDIASIRLEKWKEIRKEKDAVEKEKAKVLKKKREKEAKEAKERDEFLDEMRKLRWSEEHLSQTDFVDKLLKIYKDEERMYTPEDLDVEPVPEDEDVEVLVEEVVPDVVDRVESMLFGGVDIRSMNLEQLRKVAAKMDVRYKGKKKVDLLLDIESSDPFRKERIMDEWANLTDDEFGVIKIALEGIKLPKWKKSALSETIKLRKEKAQMEGRGDIEKQDDWLDEGTILGNYMRFRSWLNQQEFDITDPNRIRYLWNISKMRDKLPVLGEENLNTTRKEWDAYIEKYHTSMPLEQAVDIYTKYVSKNKPIPKKMFEYDPKFEQELLFSLPPSKAWRRWQSYAKKFTKLKYKPRDLKIGERINDCGDVVEHNCSPELYVEDAYDVYIKNPRQKMRGFAHKMGIATTRRVEDEEGKMRSVPILFNELKKEILERVPIKNPDKKLKKMAEKLGIETVRKIKKEGRDSERELDFDEIKELILSKSPKLKKEVKQISDSKDIEAEIYKVTKSRIVPVGVWGEKSNLSALWLLEDAILEGDKPDVIYKEFLMGPPYNRTSKQADELWDTWGTRYMFPPKDELPVRKSLELWLSTSDEEKSTPEVRDVLAHKVIMEAFKEKEGGLLTHTDFLLLFNKDENMAKEMWKRYDYLTEGGIKRLFVNYFRKDLETKGGNEILLRLNKPISKSFLLKRVENDKDEIFKGTGIEYNPNLHETMLVDALEHVVDFDILAGRPEVAREKIVEESKPIEDQQTDATLESIEIMVPVEDVKAVTEDELDLLAEYKKEYKSEPEPWQLANAYGLTLEKAKAIWTRDYWRDTEKEYGKNSDQTIKAALKAKLKDITDFSPDDSMEDLKDDLNFYRGLLEEYRRRTGETLKYKFIFPKEFGSQKFDLNEVYEFAYKDYSEEFVTPEDISLIVDFARENNKLPEKRDIFEMFKRPSKAEFFWGKVLRQEIPFDFSDVELEEYARKRGLETTGIERAKKLFRESGRTALPMTLLEQAINFKNREQDELRRAYEALAPRGKTVEKLVEIKRVSHTRHQHIEKLNALIKSLEDEKEKTRHVREVEISKLDILEDKPDLSDKELKEVYEIKEKILMLDIGLATIVEDIREANIKKRVGIGSMEEFDSEFVKMDKGKSKVEDNFEKRVIYVKHPNDKFVAITVRLPMIKEFWVDELRDKRVKMIADKEKDIDKMTPAWEGNYKKFVRAKESLKEIEDDMDVTRKSYYKAKDYETLKSLSNKFSRLSSQSDDLEDELFDLSEKLLTIDEMERIEPTIEGITGQKKYKDVADPHFSDSEIKKLAVIGFMNTARDLGYYEYMMKLADIGSDIGMADAPLAYFAPPESKFRDVLFRSWLQHALKGIDIDNWDKKTMKQFVGDYVELCPEVKEGSLKERWKKCATNKASLIQSMAIERTDPQLVYAMVDDTQPNIKDILETEELIDVVLRKQDFCFSVEELESIRTALEESLETNTETQEVYSERAETLLEKGKQSTSSYKFVKQSIENLAAEADSIEELLEKFSREGLVCSTEE